jgi:ribosome-associated protein
MPSPESYQLLLAAAAACEDKKAEDIRILALDPAESGLTDYFLICNGTNDRQNIAITDEIELRLKRDFGTYPNSVEGRRQGEWILMDYVDFIVHVFSAEKRAFYGLERLRKSATTISVADLNAELKAAVTATRASQTKAKKSPVKTSAKGAVAAKPSIKAPRVRKTSSKETKPKGTARKSAKASPKK